MKAPSPAFQFYPKDWLADGPVRELSHEQKGIYVDLLSIYWLEGGLPSEPERLARLANVPQRKFLRLWPDISRCFSCEENRISQKRLEEEKSKQLEYRKLQAEKGSKGGKSKRSNKPKKPRLVPGLSPAEAGAKPEGTFSVPKSLSEIPSLPLTPLPSEAPSTAAIATERNNWGSEAIDDYRERFGRGSGNPKQIVGGIGPLVEANGWPVVRPAWLRYLRESTHPAPSAQDFRAHFADWLPLGKGSGRGQAEAEDRPPMTIEQKRAKAEERQREWDAIREAASDRQALQS